MKKYVVSRYTDKLRELADFSAKIDRAIVNDADFLNIQRVRDKIEFDHAAGDYTEKQYRHLINIAFYLVDECRDVLSLNARIKEIERDSAAQRRKGGCSA